MFPIFKAILIKIHHNNVNQNNSATELLNEGKNSQIGIKINYSCLPETGKEIVLLCYFAFQSTGLVASGLEQTSHSPLWFLEKFFLSQLQGLDLLHAADRPLLFSGNFQCGFGCKLCPCCPYRPTHCSWGWTLSRSKAGYTLPLLLLHRALPDHSTVVRTTWFAAHPHNIANIPFAAVRWWTVKKPIGLFSLSQSVTRQDE